jgi:hypothetical protein
MTNLRQPYGDRSWAPRKNFTRSGAALQRLPFPPPGGGGYCGGWRQPERADLWLTPSRTLSSNLPPPDKRRGRSSRPAGEPLQPTPTAAASPAPLLPAPLVEPLRPGDYGAVGRGEPVPATSGLFRRLGEAFGALVGHRERPLLLGLLLLAAAAALPEVMPLPEPAELPELSPQELEELRQLLPQRSVLFREDPYRWAAELFRQLGCADFRGLVEGETLLEAQQRHRNYLSFLDRFLRPWAQATAPSDAALLAEQTYLRTLSGTCAREKAALLEQLPSGALRDARLKLVDE